MKILDIHKTENNTYITGTAKVELNLGEIVAIINAIYEYCANHHESKNYYENPAINGLYYNLETIRDILNYGGMSIDIVRFWSRDLSEPTKTETEEEVEF